MENEYWSKTKAILGQEEDLSTFKCWMTLLTVPLYSLDDGWCFYALRNADLLRDRLDTARWLAAMKEPTVGHTEHSYRIVQRAFSENMASSFIWSCSCWTMKAVNHLLEYEVISGKSIHDYEQIVDFGAGIGEISRVLRAVGYKGELFIYDLPEISRISSYYLNALDYKFTAVDSYNAIPNNKRTLFIGTWSLSEVPFALRNEIVDHFSKQDFFIIYQNKVFEYDNEQYFKEEFPKHAKINCKLVEMLLPYPEEDHRSFMLVGGPGDEVSASAT